MPKNEFWVRPASSGKSGSSGKPGSSGSSAHAGPSSLPNSLSGSSRGVSASKTKTHARHSSRSAAGRSSTTHLASSPDMLPMVSPHSHIHPHSHSQAHSYPHMHRRGTDSNDSLKSSDSDDREEKESRPTRTPSRHRRSARDSESHAFHDPTKTRSAPIPIPRKKNAYGEYDSGDIDDIDEIYKKVSPADFREARYKTAADYPPIELHEKPETVHGTNKFIPPHIIMERTRSKKMARSVGRTSTPYYWE